MKKDSLIILVVMLSLLVFTLPGCSSVNVVTESDPVADYVTLQSFGWMPHQPVPSGPQGARPAITDNTLFRKRVERAITTELAGRGFKIGAFGQPDFLIAYHVGAQLGMDSANWGYQHFDGSAGSSGFHQYEPGTLVIDIVDSRSLRLLWRGLAQGVVTNRDRSKEKISKAIKSILNKFPPE